MIGVQGKRSVPRPRRPGFVIVASGKRAVLYRLDRDHEGSDLTVHYELKNRESLERYLKSDAPRLRQEAVDRFGEKFKAVRRVLEFGGSYGSKKATPTS